MNLFFTFETILDSLFVLFTTDIWYSKFKLNLHTKTKSNLLKQFDYLEICVDTVIFMILEKKKKSFKLSTNINDWICRVIWCSYMCMDSNTFLYFLFIIFFSDKKINQHANRPKQNKTFLKTRISTLRNS